MRIIIAIALAFLLTASPTHAAGAASQGEVFHQLPPISTLVGPADPFPHKLVAIVVAVVPTEADKSSLRSREKETAVALGKALAADSDYRDFAGGQGAELLKARVLAELRRVTKVPVTDVLVNQLFVQ